MAPGGIEFRTSASGITPDQLDGGFFDGWASPLSPEEHLKLLRAAAHVALALDDDQVVGFVNALSDGVLTAYIPLLEVLPAHRGDGIGTELVRRLVAEIGPLYMIDVMCDADVFPFYGRLGFHQAGGGIVRNYDWRDHRAGTRS